MMYVHTPIRTFNGPRTEDGQHGLPIFTPASNRTFEDEATEHHWTFAQ